MNADINPGLDPVKGGHQWVTVCCSSDLLLVFDSFGRSLAQMEKDYTEPQLRASFLWAYPDSAIVTNTFAGPGSGYCCVWALCRSSRVAVPRGRGLCKGDFGPLARLVTLANDKCVVDLVPVVPTVPLERGGGDPDYSCYASDGEKTSNHLAGVYYSPKGYWWSRAAVTKLAKVAGVSKSCAEEWLAKQAIWQIYLPPSL